MKYARLIIFPTLFLFSTGAFAQVPVKICNDSALNPGGVVHVYQSEAIRLDLQHKGDPNDDGTMPGYRVQAYAGSDRGEAQKIKNDLSGKFNYAVYMVYEAPYFKIRVGDFRNRLEAQKLLHDLKKDYTSILLVPGTINWPDLKQ